MRSTTSNPPNSAQPGGSQPCSIQQIAAHMAAVTSNWPIQGWPRSCPTARTSPCPGGYIDMYVGC